MSSPTKVGRSIHRSFARFVRGGESAQAFIEFAFVTLLLVIMLFAVIDFGRFVYERQVVVNLSREGANLVLRGTLVTNAAVAIMTSASPLQLNAKGRLIFSVVTNSNGVRRVTSQLTTGLLTSAISKIGVVGGTATMPSTATVIPTSSNSLYVTEVYYTFTPITPLGKLLKFAAPSNLYDVAYF